MPRYETKQDLLNEEEVIKRFCKPAGFSYTKLEQNSLDFLVHEGKEGKCFAEVKCGGVPSTKYPIQVLSLIKWEKMKTFDSLMPTFLVYKYSDDVILYIRAKDITGAVEKISRANPREGNTNDTEFVVKIPKSLFKRLKE